MDIGAEDLFPANEPNYSKSLVRAAYESVVARAARLHAFGTCTWPRNSPEISEKQESLAVDDLIVFAINARRLIDSSNLLSYSRNININIWKFMIGQTETQCWRTEDSINLRAFLNTVIHNDFLEIVRNHSKACIVFKQHHLFRYTLEGLNFPPADLSFPAKILAKSDRQSPIVVDVGEMVSIFSERILESAVDYWEDRGLALDGDVD